MSSEFMIACGTGRNVVILALPVAKPIMVLDGHSEFVVSVAWCPTQPQILCTGGNDETLLLWDVAEHRPRPTPLATLDTDGTVLSVSWNIEGTLLAAGCGSRVRVYRIDVAAAEDAFTELCALPEEGDAASCVAFSPREADVLASCVDDTVGIWRVGAPTEPPQLLRVLAGHTQLLFKCAWFPSSNELVSCSLDHSVRRWNCEQASCTTFDDDGDDEDSTSTLSYTFALAISHDGTKMVTVASCGRDCELWDLSTNKVLHVLRHSMLAQTVAFSNCGRFVLTGSRDSTLRVWSVADGVLLSEFVVGDGDDRRGVSIGAIAVWRG